MSAKIKLLEDQEMKEVTVTLSFDEGTTHQEVANCIDELCKNGIGRGCFQDYRLLSIVLENLSRIERALSEKGQENGQ